MTWYVMGAIGAALLFVLGSGCAMQPDMASVSAMVRTDDSRPDLSRARVTIDLGQIVIP
jgi:hypothetical protein